MTGAAQITVGLTPVVAMAIQNTLHPVHLGKMPPTTLMTFLGIWCLAIPPLVQAAAFSLTPPSP